MIVLDGMKLCDGRGALGRLGRPSTSSTSGVRCQFVFFGVCIIIIRSWSSGRIEEGKERHSISVDVDNLVIAAVIVLVVECHAGAAAGGLSGWSERDITSCHCHDM